MLIHYILGKLPISQSLASAACLLAINPHNDNIRRVLHLTLSRAMQAMMADRCFSIEIDLNQSVEEWSRSVLQSDCAVHGGRIVITNGDAPEPCCEVDDSKFCVLCFPVWAFRRIKYVIQRRRLYDDTRLEFEASGLVLCTKSDKLRKSAEAAQLLNGGKLLAQNKRAITMATQTLNTSTTSLQSDMSVEDVPDDIIMGEDDEEGDNDVFDDVTPDERGGLTPAPPPAGEHPDNTAEIAYAESFPVDSILSETKVCGKTNYSPNRNLEGGAGGMTNFAFVPDNGNQPVKQQKQLTKKDIPEVFKPPENIPSDYKPSAMKDNTRTEGNKKKTKSVMFQQTLTVEYPADTSEGAVMLTGHSSIDPKTQNTMTFLDSKHNDQIPSPRNAFLQRPDTPYQAKSKPSHMTPIKAIHDINTDSKTASPFSQDKGLKEPMPGKPALPWIGQANTGNTRNSDAINDKIAKRQRKIGLLLKDLVLSSSIIPRGKPKFLENDVFDDEPEERPGAKNTMFATSHSKSSGVRVESASQKAIHSAVNNLNHQEDKVFPYTSDLLSFPALSPTTTADDLERYGAQSKKKKKGKFKDIGADDDDENLLFKPRHTMLNLDAFGPDRNCFSDQDVNDSDITDLETEPESAISDTEGITSSRLIPVVKTDRTVSIDASYNPSTKSSGLNNPATSDTDLEITDCEAEEEALAQKLRAPRILPGAQAAHAMNASRSASAKSRDYIPPSAQPRRRGGSQNDSRRRYLALNSLRRKAYELKQNAKTKPPSPKPVHKAQLLSYNARKMPQATIMSQV
ncbi:hypothetical protein ElyMa_002023600 [Elysia marginata]|uniref:Uncharacterized protein n=1 Tax=Elysia marginata TaxID=1093978 RepID=A0AAV4F7X6_9GAST|nr:hypothetical protein ElyMa_002023600 [Elysia marginata]